ncbi:hypothetical protein M0R01_03665 [bacterium]|nr:hypothetical protein [bacterium]
MKLFLSNKSNDDAIRIRIERTEDGMTLTDDKSLLYYIIDKFSIGKESAKRMIEKAIKHKMELNFYKNKLYYNIATLFDLVDEYEDFKQHVTNIIDTTRGDLHA